MPARSAVYRAKMLAALRRAYRDGRFAHFRDFDDPEGFARLARTLMKVDWYVYAKPTFTHGAYVVDYLGRYTHRVGLANSRLLAVDERAVTFRTKGAATTTVTPLTLLSRFVQHVLPPGFRKIRHVGLYASRAKRDRARSLLGTRVTPRNIRSWRQRLYDLTGRDVTRCPVCQSPMVSRALPLARAPPPTAA